MNADGIIGTNETYLGYNLYAYCENNPINNSDPEGNIAGALAIGGGIILGGAVKAFIGIVAKAAVAVTCAVVTASAVKSIANTKTNSSSKKQKENHNVYTLVDKSGKVEYVGRTTDVQARRSQHNLNPYKKELEMVVEYSNVPYEVARVKEQELIIKYQTLNRGNYRNNQINGLSFNNPKKDRYFKITADYFGEETYVGGIEW